MFAINKGRKSKHSFLREILLSRIKAGEFRPGDSFVSTRQVMRHYGFSVSTVTRAMSDLTREGWLVRKIGSGTVVNPELGGQAERKYSDECSIVVNWLPFEDQTSWSRVSPENHFIRLEIQRGIVNFSKKPLKLEFWDDYLTALNRDDTFGGICITTLHSKQHNLLRKANVPVIKVVTGGLSVDDDTLCSDQLTGCFELMRYLVRDLGHRRIGMITMRKWTHDQRFGAYQIALRTFQIDYDEKLVRFVKSGDEEAGYKAMTSLMKLKRRPTAVFVDTDLKACGAIRAAWDMGLRVPEDVSVAGFDNIKDAESFDVPLTTVSSQYYNLGRMAVENLEERVELGRPVPFRRQPSRLIIRKSCMKVKEK